MLSGTQAREVVHLLILERLVALHGGRAVILKGGVNLRMFFGSPRYSEDIDLDGARDRSEAIRASIKAVFDDRELRGVLRKLGIRGLDPGEGPNKDTRTTFRSPPSVSPPRRKARCAPDRKIGAHRRLPSRQKGARAPRPALETAPATDCQWNRSAAIFPRARIAQFRSESHIRVNRPSRLQDKLLNRVQIPP